MITAIQVNYTERGVLGELETRNDRVEHSIEAVHAKKAVEFVVKRSANGSMCAAVFTHDDGTSDAIWQERGQRGTRMLTWRHDSGSWSSDAPVEVSAAEFKRLMKNRLESVA